MRRATAFIAAITIAGCAASPPCRKGPKDDVTVGGRTAGEAVKTGAKTGLEGVKAAGEAVGGYVEGGSAKARAEWAAGKKATKATAEEGGSNVKKEAEVPECGN